jgi:hypothetical protein
MHRRTCRLLSGLSGVLLSLYCAHWAGAQALGTTVDLAVTAGGTATTSVSSGTVVSLTATVHAVGTAVQLGTVNFCDASAKSCSDIHLLGTAQLTKAGTAAMKFRPGVGNHTYKAVFLGTKTNAASTSSLVALTVTRPTVTGGYATTTAITQSGSPGDYTLTATVSVPRGIASPTGTVSFQDTSEGNFVLDTAALGAGAPGFSWSNSQNIRTDYFEVTAPVDLNGDGIPDIVATGEYVVALLLGKGDGTFATEFYLGTYCWSPSINVGDFDGDGVSDMAFTCPGVVEVYLRKRDGTFTYKSTWFPGDQTNNVQVADFNGDGKLDLAIASTVCCSGTTSFLAILLGNGDGTFTAAPNVPSPSQVSAVTVADFNGDGIPDLAFSNNYASNNSVVIMLGKGDGTFTAGTSLPAGSGDNVVIAGDFNGDGKEDLALLYPDAQDNTVLKIMLGHGDGTFSALPTGPTTFPVPAGGVCLGDFDGDDILDLAIMNRYGWEAMFLLGKGDGTFPSTMTSPRLGGSGCTEADFNGDGISDLIAYPGAVWLMQPTETATATATGVSVVGSSGLHQVKASYHGDANHQSSTSGTVGLYPAATHFSVTAPSNAGANAPFNITVTALDANGSTATAYAGTVSFTSSDGSAVLPGASTLTAGTKTFTVRLKTQGNQTITATDTANSLTGTSAAIAVGGVDPGQDSVNFGSQAIGSPSGTHTLSFKIGAGTTVGGIAVVTQGAPNLDFTSAAGGTCTTKAYSSDTNCTVNVVFKPRAAGGRYGAVVFTDSSGGLLATVYLQGTGVGPVVTFANSTFGNYAASSQTLLAEVSASQAAVDASGNIFVIGPSWIHTVREIVAVNGSIPASPTIKTLGSGFVRPFGLALDGAGNVFVADDRDDGNFVKEILAVSGYTMVTTLASGFSLGLAVDGGGNVFATDWHQRTVYEILAEGGYTTIKTLATGVGAENPALDGSGNVYFVGDGAVKEILAASGYTTVRTLVTGDFSSVVPDSAGNLYVVDASGAVKEILAEGGYTTIKTLGPYGTYATPDGSGNVIVTGVRGSVVKLDYADPPSLTFNKTPLGVKSSDSPQSITVSNIGNADLKLPAPGSGNNPALSSGFTFDTATTCAQVTASSSTGILTAGTSCTYAIDFIPATAGTNSGSLILTDNNLNAAAPPGNSQKITLNVNQNNVPPWGSISQVIDGRTHSTTVAQADNLVVGGWAVDPQDAAPVSRVQILIDGNDVGNATMGLPRSDVAARYNNPWYLNSGWTLTHPASGLSLGMHSVQAVAYDTLGLSTGFGAVWFKVDTTSVGPPWGAISVAMDARTHSTIVAQADNVFVGGWAVDPQDGAPVSRVQILIDGKDVGNATLNLYRPDVATAYNNPAYRNSGWSLTYPASGLSKGTHTVQAVAYDKLSLSKGLPVVSFTVDTTSVGPPWGAISVAWDARTHSTTIAQADNVFVGGWAVDPQDGAPVSRVQILIDGKDVGNATLNLYRPDVATAYNNPAYRNSGWSLTYSASGLSVGTHTVAAVGYDSLGLSRTLSTSTFTVAAP